MSDPPTFDSLVGDELAGDERARLERVHGMLLEAGAPPELSPRLAEPPSTAAVEPVPLRRRFRATTIAIAAVVAALLFGAGYVLGGGSGPASGVQTLALTGQGEATGQLVVFERDAAGNWPMELTVSGLPRLPGRNTYELWLTRDGEPAESCGTFVVADEETTVRLNAPYRLSEFTGWVVRTGFGPGSAVLTTGNA